MDGFRSFVANYKTVGRFPPLQGPHVDTCESARWFKARTRSMSFFN
jgi:hypothetical protein